MKILMKMVLLSLSLLGGTALAGDSLEKQGASCIIPKEKMEQFELDAVHGNGSKAFLLYRCTSVNPLNFERSDYWLLVGAENGDIDSQYSLAVSLLEPSHAQLTKRTDAKTRHLDIERGMYWLGKAAEKGDAQSADRLAKIKKGEIKIVY